MDLAAMPPRLLAGARGRLLMFNLLVVAVTLMVSSVAIIGFHHAGTIQAQERTLDDMAGSLALARDTANVATAAVRLSQVIGALEYRSEADRLRQTQSALQHSLSVIAVSPLARSEPDLVRLITERSLTLEQSIGHLLTLSHISHLQRNQLLSALYQCQLTLAHIDEMMRRQGRRQPAAGLRREIDQLLTIAIDTPSPHAVMFQLDRVMRDWPGRQKRAQRQNATVPRRTAAAVSASPWCMVLFANPAAKCNWTRRRDRGHGYGCNCRAPRPRRWRHHRSCRS